MDETKKPTDIDYYTYEESMSRAERHVKRWVMAFVIVFLSFVIYTEMLTDEMVPGIYYKRRSSAVGESRYRLT